MQFEDIHQRLCDRFGAAILRAEPAAIDPWIEVAGGSLPEIGLFLRDEPALRFNMLHCISGVDYFEPDAKKAAAVKWQPHLEVLYHLSSLVHKHRLVLNGHAAALAGRRAGPPARRAQRQLASGRRPIGTSARCST